MLQDAREAMLQDTREAMLRDPESWILTSGILESRISALKVKFFDVRSGILTQGSWGEK